MLRQGKLDFTIVVKEFTPHTEENCICNKKKGSQLKKKVIQAKVLDSHLLKLGFVKLNADINDRIYYIPSFDGKVVSADTTLHVNDNGEWSIVFGCNVTAHDDKLPEILTDENIECFCKIFRELNVCEGITDYVDVINRFTFRYVKVVIKTFLVLMLNTRHLYLLMLTQAKSSVEYLLTIIRNDDFRST